MLIINMSESALLANFKEYYQTGIYSVDNKKYNSAANEFFKAFITLCDMSIYRKLKILPNDHTDRFTILKINFPKLFKIDNSLFDIYRRTYKLRLSSSEVKQIQKGVIEVAKILNIETDM
jgi:hypothetical protein